MTITNIKYSTSTALVDTGTVMATLAAGNKAVWDQVDNTGSTELFVDVLVGGQIRLGTGALAGDTVDVYVVATYSDTTTDVGSAMDATGAISTTSELLTDGGGTGEFVLENAVQIASVLTETASEIYHWGPVGLAQYFGGSLPKYWSLIFHNNTTAAFTTGSGVDYIGIEYENV